MAKKESLTLDHNYTEDSIQSLDWKQHIRLRPGMYIGKLGDGASKDDGIYVLLKEVVDNCIDEYVMGYGKQIEVDVKDGRVRIRDYGRGIPLGKVVECVSKINTGGKYDSQAFQKSVGLNGVGTKAVNALSKYFRVQSVRQGKTTWAEFTRGELTATKNELPTNLNDGTEVIFDCDPDIFTDYEYRMDYIEIIRF
jgi:topoisomerase IV subunit B